MGDEVLVRVPNTSVRKVYSPQGKPLGVVAPQGEMWCWLPNRDGASWTRTNTMDEAIKALVDDMKK